MTTVAATRYISFSSPDACFSLQLLLKSLANAKPKCGNVDVATDVEPAHSCTDIVVQRSGRQSILCISYTESWTQDYPLLKIDLFARFVGKDICSRSAWELCIPNRTRQLKGPLLGGRYADFWPTRRANWQPNSVGMEAERTDAPGRLTALLPGRRKLGVEVKKDVK